MTKSSLIAIDRSGNMEHQANTMLELLGCLMYQKPVTLAIFDSEKKQPKYFVNFSYQEADGQTTRRQIIDGTQGNGVGNGDKGLVQSGQAIPGQSHSG